MSQINIDCARDCVAVTPSNSVTFTPPLNGIFVGTGGILQILTPAGNVVEFLNVPSGTTVPVQASQVQSTNTTAAAIVGLK